MPEKRKRPADLFAPIAPPTSVAPAPKPTPPPLRPSDPAAGSPLVGRAWLLCHPHNPDDQLVPGALAMHIRPSTIMRGRWVYLYVVEAVRADPEAHRLLVWLHAAPVSAYPGLRRVLPVSELIPWKWRPGLPSLEHRKGWAPAHGGLIEESDAQAKLGIQLDLDQWLDNNWLALAEAARVSSPQADDPTNEGLSRLNLPVIERRESLRQQLTDWMRVQGATNEALRRAWGEAGVPSWELAELLAPSPGL